MTCHHLDCSFKGSDPRRPTRCECTHCGQVWVLTDRCLTPGHPRGLADELTGQVRYHWCPL